MEHRGVYDSVDSVYFAQQKLDRAIESLHSMRGVSIPPGVTFDGCGWRFVYGDKRLSDCDFLEIGIVARSLFQKVQELQIELDKKQAQPVHPALELLR